MSSLPQFLSTLRDYLNDGWRPFEGVIKKEFTQTLPCAGGSAKDVPFWIYRGDIYLCLGCHQSCTSDRSHSFSHAINVRHNTPPKDVYCLSPKEMLVKKALLNVHQAAYCLNVSNKAVYKYIYDGRLPATKDKPLRVRSSDVAAMIENIDE